MEQPKIIRYANTIEEADNEVDLVKRTLTNWELPFSYDVYEHPNPHGFVITFTILCESEKSES